MTVEELIKALEQMPCKSSNVVMADYMPVERVVWDPTYGEGVAIITDVCESIHYGTIYDGIQEVKKLIEGKTLAEACDLLGGYNFEENDFFDYDWAYFDGTVSVKDGLAYLDPDTQYTLYDEDGNLTDLNLTEREIKERAKQ